MSNYHVTATWDDESKLWVAWSDDVPGLATGAETLEALTEKLKLVIPELLFENQRLPRVGSQIRFEINAKRVCSAPVR